MNKKAKSSAITGSNWVKSNQAAWMTFQRLRGNNTAERKRYSPVHTARTWPECHPAGLSTLEQYIHNWRTSPLPGSLPPLNSKKGFSNVRNNFMSKRKDWARTWAQQRSGWTHAQAWEKTNGITNGPQNQASDKRLAPLLPISNLKRQVVELNKKDAAELKRAKGIYDNSSYRTFREERIKNTLRSLHLSNARHEIKTSLKEYQKKSEKDKQAREELMRIRNKFVKEKKEREQRSYMRLSAFEAPQVSRKSFGLPDEGHELLQGSTAKKTEEKMREIWRKNMKRAAVIETFLSFRHRVKDCIPDIKIKESRRVSNAGEKPELIESLARILKTDKLKVNFIKNELDILSSVDLDDEEDRMNEFSE